MLDKNSHTSPLINKLIYIGGTLGPLTTMPQVYKIWVGKNAIGVSVVSWCAYAIGSAFWIWYGIANKQRPLVFTYSMFLIVEIMIIVGTLIYGSGF
jgi:uncharacterized protein with PQ loop repeat